MARGASYRPRAEDDAQVDVPRKRQRLHNSENNNDRRRSRSPDCRQNYGRNRGTTHHYGGGASYRPSYSSNPLRHDRYRPDHRQTPLRSEERSHPRYSAHDTYRATDQEPRSGSLDSIDHRKRSKKQRKENPSTRIHSLRKQLSRASNLPSTIVQERERELAALLFEQEKNKLKHSSKKNLERYHFIRFIERQKATRNLKKLKKSKEAGDTIWKDPDEVKNDGLSGAEEIPIDNKIHEYEVDLLYTQYSPLGQKYIALYAEVDTKTGEKVSHAERYKGNWKLMKRQDLAILTQEQRETLQKESEETAGLVDLNSGGIGGTGVTVKPPLWYEIEAMIGDQPSLEALRDSKGLEPAELVMGMTNKPKVGEKRKSDPDWMADDGMIDAADLDSESDEDGGDGGTRLNKADSDEDMSDGDGGFFEKK